MSQSHRTTKALRQIADYMKRHDGAEPELVRLKQHELDAIIIETARKATNNYLRSDAAGNYFFKDIPVIIK